MKQKSFSNTNTSNERQKIMSVAKMKEIATSSNDSTKSVIENKREEKVKNVVQTNLTPIRCGSCNAMLAQATTGSVVAIVCSRCKSFNFIEVVKEMRDNHVPNGNNILNNFEKTNQEVLEKLD